MTYLKRGAFTLIELLVVIAIIAVLVAITMPAFRTVQETARTMKCASNLRQIGAALFLFAADHRNTFPQAATGTLAWSAAGSATQGWMQQISTYIGNPGDPALSKTGNVFTCPSSSLVSGAVTKSYSYFLGAHAAYAARGGAAAVNRTWISTPAELILGGDITDGAGTSVSDADKNDFTQNPIDLISPYHNGTVNLLYADGHVAPAKWKTNTLSQGYFDPTQMATHYLGTGPSAGQYYTYLNP